MKNNRNNKNKKDKKNSKSDNSALKKTVSAVYDIMLENDLNQVSWEEKDKFKLKLTRKSNMIPANAVVPSQSLPDDTRKETEEPKDVADYIRSPMNGIFYRSSSPGADPFVKENTDVAIGQTVCIIEAMKLMNEVQVERHCKILKVMVKNAEPVKVGQPLFEIENL